MMRSKLKNLSAQIEQDKNREHMNCPYCLARVLKFSKLFRHTEKCHRKAKLHVCVFCPGFHKFSSMSSLVEHVGSVHVKSKLVPNMIAASAAFKESAVPQTSSSTAPLIEHPEAATAFVSNRMDVLAEQRNRSANATSVVELPPLCFAISSSETRLGISQVDLY
jgi:hypothetical protein